MYRVRQFILKTAKSLGLQPLVWKLSISSEVKFWDRYFSTEGLEWKEEYKLRLDPDRPLAPRFIDYLQKTAPETEGYDLLDVGAGPLTSLGKKIPGKEIRLRAVDPLADEYDKLMETYKVNPPVRTESCKGEELTRQFSDASFDLVYARNCLDHGIDPVGAFREMLQITKPGGLVLLEHWPNEGETEDYRGLHQWNFDCQDGEFIVWNRKQRQVVAEELGENCRIECSMEVIEEDKPMVVSRIWKLS